MHKHAANDSYYQPRLCALVDYRPSPTERLAELRRLAEELGVSPEDFDALVAARERELNGE